MYARIRNGLWLSGLILICNHSFALDEAVGVNQTLEEGFGARHSGMAVTFAGFHSDADAVANAPAAMNDVDDFTFSTAHSEKFGVAKFDDFAVLVPFETNTTLGLGLARYGVNDIEGYTANDTLVHSATPSYLFSAADYLLVAAFARRWGALDAGANLNILYRHLDQNGLGTRGDAMVQYTWTDRYRAGALVKGLIPSSARWSSSYAEYERPDLYLGGAVKLPAPYFYGSLQAAYQTQGLFQKQAKSAKALKGKALQDALTAGSLGLEYLFDFGLTLRFGLSELSELSGDAARFGISYTWRRILGLDYGFAPHPDLLSSHYVALRFTPAFSRFEGRNYRGRREVRPQPSRIVPRNGDISAPAKNPAPSPSAAKPGQTPEPDAKTVPVNPAPGAAPAENPAPPPHTGDKEILEEGE